MRSPCALKPSIVHVKKFETRDGDRLLDGESSWFELFDLPSDGSEEDQESIRTFLQNTWLRDGQFTFTAGNSPWINNGGEIVAT